MIRSGNSDGGSEFPDRIIEPEYLKMKDKTKVVAVVFVMAIILSLVLPKDMEI